MFGWINDCTEQLVITKFGLEKWHEIKKVAGCEVKDYGFVRHEYYPDSSTVNLVVAASQVLGIPVPGVLEAFGQFFMEFVRGNGYENLLRCQGSALRPWLSNLNALHDHLESSLPPGLVAPVFWCEDCDAVEGSILLHYYSWRGSLLVPLVVGVVKEVARFHFNLEINMEQLNMQGEDGAENTTWRITTVNPQEQWKLKTADRPDERIPQRRVTMLHRNSAPNIGTYYAELDDNDHYENSAESRDSNYERPEERNGQKPLICPFSGLKIGPPKPPTAEGISLEQLKTFFPYHVLVNQHFTIQQIGSKLPYLLTDGDADTFLGKNIGQILKITRPVLAGWNWSTLMKLEDQVFFLESTNQPGKRNGVHDPTNRKSVIKFKASLITLSSTETFKNSHAKSLFILSPDAKNVNELNDMGLTMSDLPSHSFQRDAVFLGEHIASEVRSAHMLDKLSKKLENEKNLSNQLLYNMLPRSVADELRSGRTVEPAHFENVTLFFSDVVGFTTICDQIAPWDVIDMLNQLYSVMDYLASKFALYKVETIGDAYMCCSGMPIQDEYHAENIANFAIAAMECVKHVKNPVDNSPIRLRIGIHTGEVMGGVVGTLTPHYCLFGDMVNTTSRHESTGLPGKIQCSSALFGRLKHFGAHDTDQYNFSPRGLVMMKGKGECYTYWLESGTETNELVNPNAMNMLYEEVGQMLAKKKWKKRKYFRRSSLYGGSQQFTVFDTTQSATASTVCSTQESTSEKNDFDDNPESDIKSDIISDAGSYAGSDAGSAAGSDDESRAREMKELDAMIEDVDSTEQDNLSDKDNITNELPCNTKSWLDVEWDRNLNREDLVHSIHKLLMKILARCLQQEKDAFEEKRMSLLDRQMFGFVQRISTLCRDENRFHNWRHVCHVTLCASYLMKCVRDDGEEGIGIDANPWYQFIAAFSALIHDVKHLGVSNRQLEVEEHFLIEVYDDSFQERQSINSGLTIFLEEFPVLATEVLQACPLFVKLVNCTVLATDIASKDVQMKCKEKFERVLADAESEESLERTEAALEHVIMVADVAHCSQKYDTFLRWNRMFYEECLVNNISNRGFDPRNGWYEGQIGFLKNYIFQLVERCDTMMPKQFGLKKNVENNLKSFMELGQTWTNQMIDDLMPDKDGNINF